MSMKAEQPYHQAASAGNSKAQFSLAMLIMEDGSQAAEYWLELALANHRPNAQYVLDMLHNGGYEDVC